jgi:hypothetical protein
MKAQTIRITVTTEKITTLSCIAKKYFKNKTWRFSLSSLL